MLTRDEIERLRSEAAFKQIITENSCLIEKLNQVKCAGAEDINILLLGETGTGKDLCAQAIHFLSNRRNKPFITLNCGMGPLELFDSVLFGHVKGAFTNAIHDHPGLVEEADGGILFLDEINSMPQTIQVKLNRFISTGEFRRLGENKLRRVDVRIIAATNQSLEAKIKNGFFREDLYYRLAEYIIDFPPLRMRGNDIKLLMDHFLVKYGNRYHKTGLSFTDRVYEKADQYHWPGNIRELENVIKRCVINAIDSVITENEFVMSASHKSFSENGNFLHLPLQEAKARVVDSFEREYLDHHLYESGGNVEKCARTCGKHRSALWALLKKHHIDPQNYRT